MKKTRFLKAFLLMMLFSGLTGTIFSQNFLSVPAIEAGQGKDIVIPVHLNNTGNVSAMQFTLSLPEGLVVDKSKMVLSDRKDDHYMSIRELGNNKFMFIALSNTNAVFSGSSGSILDIPVTIPVSFIVGREYPITLSDVVISNANAENITGASQNGKITIRPAASPDLAVKDVQPGAATATPDEILKVSWTVENVGDSVSPGGWSEKIYLVSVAEGTKTLIASDTYTNDLPSSGIAARSMDIRLPKIVGIDGQARIQIEIVPKTKELLGKEANNQAISSGTTDVEKRFFIQISPETILENSNSSIRCILTRSGSTKTALDAGLSADKTDRLTIPATATIPVNQSGVTFYVKPIDNDLLEGDVTVNIIAGGNSYPDVSAPVIIQDSEETSLTISSDLPAAIEGEDQIVKVTVGRNLVVNTPLTVSLSSGQPNQWTFPAEVIIPSGEASITFDVTITDDDIPEGTASALLKATAPKTKAAILEVVIIDDDVPEISLVIEPATVSEATGPNATWATVSRVTPGKESLRIVINASHDGQVFFPAEITLKPNESGKMFNIGTIDNNLVDGNRTITLSASIYISSCRCSNVTSAAGSVDLLILDDDGPTLTLSVDKGALPEGKETAGALTISRNTTENSNPLTVNLSHNKPEEIEIPTTVVIPAGSASISIPVKTLDDGVTDGNQLVSITATAENFTQGVCWVIVSDQNKPDLEINQVQLLATSVHAEGTLQVNLTINNTGMKSAPPGVDLRLYLSKDVNYDDSDIPLTTHKITQGIDVDTPIAQQVTVPVPAVTGNYYIIAYVNPDQQIDELLDVNNRLSSELLTVLPEYTANISIAKSIFKGGEEVLISGKAEYMSGQPVVSKEVDVYVVTGNFRREWRVTTNGTGDFTYTFIPVANEAGHYYAGACYPDQKLSEQQAVFDIPGIKEVTKRTITWDVPENHEVRDSIRIQNISPVALNNVRVEILSAPQNCQLVVEPINRLNADAITFLKFRVTGTTPSAVLKYEEIKLRVTSDENMAYDLSTWFYCRIATGALKATPGSINTTMTKNTTRMYEFTLENTGYGETGEITIAMPQTQWMRIVSPAKIASIPENGSTTVTLELSPTEDMQLNSIVTGTIGLNCTNGKGLSLPFRIETVSESTGSLLVDVVDEYTYFTESAPHVANAYVLLRHPVTGATVAYGYTKADGTFQINDIREGYYTLVVQADKHESYQSTILIDPGMLNRKSVYISFQAITYTWNVVPTEVEDEYDIQVIAKYETNVPVPVVIAEMPDKMPTLKSGETYSFMITLTNKGLITARKVTNVFADDPEYEFICLVDKVDIPAQQAIQVPVVMQRKTEIRSGVETRSNTYPCKGYFSYLYSFLCADEFQNREGVKPFSYEDRICHYAMLTGPTPTQPVNPGTPPKPGSGEVGGGMLLNGPIDGNEMKIKCDPCELYVLEYIEKMRPYKEIKWVEPENVFTSILFAGASLLAEFAENSVVGHLVAIVETGYELYTEVIQKCADAGGYSPRSAMAVNTRASNSSIEAYSERLGYVYNELNAMMDYLTEFMGDPSWKESESLAFAEFMKQVIAKNTANGIVDVESLRKYLPSNITDDVFLKFITRWNNSAKGNTSGEVISIDKLTGFYNSAMESKQKAQEYGYSSVSEMYVVETQKARDYLNSNDGAVCATITVQFSQRLTMTREAFEGTLTITNGNTTTAMKNVKLDLVIRNEVGEISNDMFQINTKALSILTGIDGSGTLDANAKGSATIIFIPTKDAAPVLPQSYSFGGTLSYLDPFTNEMVSRPLSAVTLQVNPSPDLYLNYFLQRNVFGDDALTPNVIEPIIPAELAVLIHNRGAGEAKNVRINSAQPKIIDNEKGLSIHFEIIGANLNGKPMSPGLTNINFGNIEAGKATTGQWWFTSTLLGHFVSYEAYVTHLDSYGNPNLSLVSGIDVHELIRSISAGPGSAEGLKDFLVNDIPDAYDIPDAIYFSDGTMTDVYPVNTANVNKGVNGNNLSIQLTVEPSREGWNYGMIDDPANGRFRLVGIKRNSDGKDIPLDNFWQTNCTLLDGKSPIYENKLHFVDNISATTTYTLTFESIDQNPPAVVAFENVPVQYIVNKLQHVVVKFNKAIDPESFTYEDITLRCQGGANLSDNKILIDRIIGDDERYLIDISQHTHASGYYVLTVQASGICDPLGNYGVAGKQASWTQMIDVPAIAEVSGIDSISATPVNALHLLFNMPIKPETFNNATLNLFRDDRQIALNNTSVSAVDETNTLFDINNLTNNNLQDGIYRLEVDLKQITSAGDKTGDTIQPINWIVDRTPPVIIDWEEVFEGGLDNQHLMGVYVTFNEEIKSLELDNISFFANEIREPISFFSIKKIDPDKYYIGNMGSITYIERQYKLILENVEDVYGNAGATPAEHAWTVDRSLPQKAANLRITPDLGSSDNDNITSASAITAIMEIKESNIQVEVYSKTLSGENLLATVSVDSPQQINVPVELPGGNVVLLVKTINVYGLFNTEELSLYIDNVPLTAIWEPLSSTHLCEMDASMALTFSDAIVERDLPAALSIYHNDQALNAALLQVNKDTDTRYIISGFENLGIVSGAYTLSVDLSVLRKHSSGLEGEGKKSVSWNVVDMESPVINQQGNILSADVMNRCQWYLNGEELPGAISSSIHASEEGIYQLRVSNNWGCFAFSNAVNVGAIPTYGLSIGAFKGGSVEADKMFAVAGETVTLTISCEPGYELNNITAFKTGDPNATFNMSGTELTRSFKMPVYGVTITATFINPDEEIATVAKELIEGGVYIVTQETANTLAGVRTWLAGRINGLNGMSATGITVTEDMITVDNFSAAVAGGANGSFNFGVSLQKGHSAVVNTSNLTGTITAAQLVNAETPVISGQPQGATVTQNGNVNLSVTASINDGGTLSYQWYSNTVNSNTGGTPVGENSNSFSPPTNTVGTMYYYVVVKNDNTNVNGAQTVSVTSNVIAVTVNLLTNAAAPVISSQPQGATVVLNGNVNLSVTASVNDGGTLSYQWYSNTTNSNTGGTTVGTNSNSYSPPTTTGGTVYYYVAITNTNTGVNGTQTAVVYSETAAVTVNAPVQGGYRVSVASTANGEVTVDKTTADTGETVTITVTPANGYELNTLSVHRTDAEATTVALSNNRTFTMPAYNVTVKATFKKTQALLDKESVDNAKNSVESGSFKVAQGTANDAASIRTWLINTLSVLFGNSQGTRTYSYNVLFGNLNGINTRPGSPESVIADVNIISVTPAIAGTIEAPKGTDGSFTYVVKLKKGDYEQTTLSCTGVIIASPNSTTVVKRIDMMYLGNLTARIMNTGNAEIERLTLTLSGDAFTLSESIVTDLSVGGETEVILTPRSGLEAGIYTITLTVVADGIEPEILTFTYQMVATDNENAKSAKLYAVSTNGGLLVCGLEEGEMFSIYNISGVLNFRARAVGNEHLVLLRDRGVYVIVSGNSRVITVY